jgi:cell division protein FtsB
MSEEYKMKKRTSRVETLEKQVHCLLLDKHADEETIRSLEQTVGDLAQENTDLILRVRALNKIVRMLEAEAKSVLNRVSKKTLNRVRKKK